MSGSHDKIVKIWDAETLECLDMLEGHEDWINAVGAIGDLVFSGSDDF